MCLFFIKLKITTNTNNHSSPVYLLSPHPPIPFSDFTVGKSICLSLGLLNTVLIKDY